MPSFHPLMVQPDWSLFLDRDGVVNARLVDQYVRHPDEFIISDETLEVLQYLRTRFAHVFIVTNQQGIGKGLMTEADIEQVHTHFLSLLPPNTIDNIYYCPHLRASECNCRKPKPGMAIRARQDFPDVDFRRSVMVGDSLGDLQFGHRLGMGTVYVQSRDNHAQHLRGFRPDQQYKSLEAFGAALQQWESSNVG